MSSSWEIEQTASKNALGNYGSFFDYIWGDSSYYAPKGWENYSTPIKPKEEATRSYF